MANKSHTDSAASTGALQRGKACLRCRKRKMRCTGEKPACQQCTRAKKADCCEYDDGKGKTRTQILRDNIVRLEQRIRELEDPDYTSPGVTLFNPHHRSQSSSSSMTGSPGSTGLSHSPYLSDSTHSPEGSWSLPPVSPYTMPPGTPIFNDDQLSRSSPPSSFDGEMYFDEPQPPFELALMLLDIFVPHRHQCGLGIHIGRLRESVTLPLQDQRHPVLMNAIFLWACFISRPEPLAQHEDHYLARALDALSDALRVGDKIVDVIQASCLLSMYFLSNGRVLEGNYHASAAAALVLQSGLHSSIFHDVPRSIDRGSAGPTLRLPPARDAIEQGERILTFWQVYNLDRCWSVVLQKPLAMPESRNTRIIINTPWPQSIQDYESSQFDDPARFSTVGQFFDGLIDGGFSPMALRAKASALFERADQLSSSWHQHASNTSSFHDQIHSLERIITQFISTLMPLDQLDTTVLEERHILIATHTLAHAAMIHLHYRFAHEDTLSYANCLSAAKSCVEIIKNISDTDFAFLDPIIGPCWTGAGETLLRELNHMDAAWPLLDSTEVQNDMGTLLYALTTLSLRFPMLRISAGKIQKRLSQR